MSSASKGKRYERELAKRISEVDGWLAERVPRSVADAQPVDDVIATCVDFEPRDAHRPITTELAVSDGRLDHEDIIQIESKYTSSGQFGIKTLVGAEDRTLWCNGWRSGLIGGAPEGVLRCWRYGEAPKPSKIEDVPPPKTAMDCLCGEADVVAFRSPRNPWILLWPGGCPV